MTRSVFRICQTKRSKPHSMDRVFAEVERDLISRAHPPGASPRGQVLGEEALGPPERAPWGIFTARGPAS